jgi:DNA-binding NarL/FixJ family response regulator
MAEPALAAELTAQDVELLALLAAGLPMEAVARRVSASERTVRRRVRAICDRLGCATTIQAIVWATRRGLV